MVFETVLRMPDSVLKGKEDVRYLRRGDLENLAEHNLLYFLRRSNYYILHDYPCMGAFEERFHSSNIEGPFESAPDIEKKVYSGSIESTAEVLELLVPTNLMPVGVENISLVNYGTQTDSDSFRHLEIVARDKIDSKEMMRIGENILEHLRRRGKVEQLSDSHYNISIEGCLSEFELEQTHFYPYIMISVFGKGETPQQLIGELGLYNLREQFPREDIDVGIKDSIKRGFAYNLDLNGKDISEVVRAENVIL